MKCEQKRARSLWAIAFSSVILLSCGAGPTPQDREGIGIAAGSPSPSVKADPTPPRFTPPPHLPLPLLWMYLPERRALVFQEAYIGFVTEIRLLDTRGQTLASGTVRKAQPGEPRQCGHPAWVPPLVAVLPISSDIGKNFADEWPSQYRVEAREASTGSWRETELLNWRKTAQDPPPCWE